MVLNPLDEIKKKNSNNNNNSNKVFRNQSKILLINRKEIKSNEPPAPAPAPALPSTDIIIIYNAMQSNAKQCDAIYSIYETDIMKS
uniref:Uncharacterized protein n=1 Tax=Glossina brevipalpis TaxID=37001 RepID=A0A1A9X2E6_9MUSC